MDRSYFPNPPFLPQQWLVAARASLRAKEGCYLTAYKHGCLDVGVELHASGLA
jgi:hypothetical protein